MANKSYFAVGFLLMASTAYAAEMPKELQGNYVYPSDIGGCESKGYSLEITKNVINANEFNCKLSGKPKGSNGKYSIPMACSSEDGSSKTTAKLELNGNSLKFDNREYLLCGAGSATTTKTTQVNASNGANQIFNCKIGSKVARVTYQDGQYTYTYGKHNSQPEITFSSNGKDGKLFHGSGVFAHNLVEQLIFVNGNVKYIIQSSPEGERLIAAQGKEEKMLFNKKCENKDSKFNFTGGGDIEEYNEEIGFW